MKKKSDISKSPMELALRYLGSRARTVREVELFLDDREFGEGDIMATVDRLMELGLLNDAQFAADFVDSRLRTKPVSRNALLRQLIERKLPRELAKEAVEQISNATEVENCFRVMESFWTQLAQLPERDRQRRACSRALARGYGYDDIAVARKKLSGDDDADFDFDADDSETDD
ncbi:MAG: RecX family transcriptional regulator [Clostridiales bacterium]|nr:RecX family transcriptional regulator [Clostridiales bacterium]